MIFPEKILAECSQLKNPDVRRAENFLDQQFAHEIDEMVFNGFPVDSCIIGNLVERLLARSKRKKDRFPYLSKSPLLIDNTNSNHRFNVMI